MTKQIPALCSERPETACGHNVSAGSACRLYRHAERLLKNEGIFRKNICVGVQWYGSQIFSRKTDSRAGFSMLPVRFRYLLQILNYSIYFFFPVVDQVFRQAEDLFYIRVTCGRVVNQCSILLKTGSVTGTIPSVFLLIPFQCAAKMWTASCGRSQ